MNQLPVFPIFFTSPYRLLGWGKAQASPDPLRRHAEAALQWIQRAGEAAQDGGISKGFDLLRGRWAPSYPETTGYTIPTLFNAGQAYNNANLNSLALSLAEYELEHATPEGGVIHWQARQNPIPIVFDTGQVLFGWLAAYAVSKEQRYLAAAQRAGGWLASIQDETGCWKNNQHLGITKTIDTRVAWALLELAQLTGQENLRQAAIRNCAWADQQQDETGWFAHCSFLPTDDPFTHTLAYTAEGLLESGTRLNEPRFIAAARKTADGLLALQRSDGSLAGTYGPAWSRPASWSCLTGNCQMARLWLRLYQITPETAYLDAARKALQFVAAVQDIHTSNLNLRGAIAGSQPLWGAYERFKTPNWAAKFFIDAILQSDEIEQGKNILIHPG